MPARAGVSDPIRLPRAHGEAMLAATLRSLPEDFVVEEVDAFEPTGSGEHVLLTLEKRNLNTVFVAKRVAQWAGVQEHAVGYAGLKDRHAVARQRFSVQLPGRETPDPSRLEYADATRDESLRVLAVARHARKVARGALAGNRFELTLRDVTGDHDGIDARIVRIATEGVPNYFGEQRFGRSGGNVGQALAMFAGKRVRREERSLLLSAARSELFNRVLARRVAEGTWNKAMEGEAWILDGSRSAFGPEPWNDVLADRLSRFDIHPSAPLWGEGELRTSGACRELEESVLAGEDSLALRRGLESARLRQERRSTRLRPQEVAAEWLDADVLQLRFSLPPGAYATTVLAELGDIRDSWRGV